ncbi:MAG TPA: ABC transporter permease [Acidobacteriota bacterium]|nr:ABC transporter permease [Acidobacteriota bacterium]
MPPSLRTTTISAALLVLLFYVGLILSLGYFFSPSGLTSLWESERIRFTVRISLAAATLATALALVIAVPAGYALSRYSFRWRITADTILELPIIVSPAALGAMLLIFFNNPLGQWIQEHFLYFVFSFAGVVLAQFTTVLGLATRFVKTALDEVPVEFERVALSLGADPAKVFFTVSLPLARRGLLTAFVLCWAKAVGEFGATFTVAGSMAMRTETLPIAIYLRLATAQIESAVSLILLLLTIGLGALFGVRLLGARLFYHAER